MNTLIITGGTIDEDFLKKYLLSISITNTPIPYTAVIGP